LRINLVVYPQLQPLRAQQVGVRMGGNCEAVPSRGAR
jgi:hypothetical protein